MTAEIELPHNWRTRGYQRPAWDALHNGCKRVAPIWHRRAGKDSLAVNFSIKQAILPPPLGRIGAYWHLLPEAKQARKAIWNGRTKDGRSFRDFWPSEVIARVLDDEMTIFLRNGSIWQLAGSDNYDSLIGANPVGIVFSEYAVSNPLAWEFLRPILAENNGWALFPFTPRGRNHGYSLYKRAKSLMERDSSWFTEILTVEDTGAISPEAIQRERDDGMPEEMVQQEFYCSWDAPLVGSIYSEQMFRAHKEGRVTRVDFDESTTVNTWWDLGRSDSTAIWFLQHVGNQIHFIDYYQNQGRDLPHYAEILDAKKAARTNWRYGRHIWPHDGKATRLGMKGEPLDKQMEKLGYKVEVQPRPRDLEEVWAQINQVRASLSRCWFDEERCEIGLDALKSYSKEEDEARSTETTKFFKERPRHDWASHGADAFRLGICADRPSPGFRKIVYPRDHPCHGVI